MQTFRSHDKQSFSLVPFLMHCHPFHFAPGWRSRPALSQTDPPRIEQSGTKTDPKTAWAIFPHHWKGLFNLCWGNVKRNKEFWEFLGVVWELNKEAVENFLSIHGVNWKVECKHCLLYAFDNFTIPHFRVTRVKENIEQLLLQSQNIVGLALRLCDVFF